MCKKLQNSTWHSQAFFTQIREKTNLQTSSKQICLQAKGRQHKLHKKTGRRQVTTVPKQISDTTHTVLLRTLQEL